MITFGVEFLTMQLKYATKMWPKPRRNYEVIFDLFIWPFRHFRKVLSWKNAWKTANVI